LFSKLWKQAHNHQLYRAYDQMPVDVGIGEEVQRAFNIFSHQIQIIRRKESTSYSLGDDCYNAFSALALDLCQFSGSRRQSGGSERIVRKKSASGRLEHGREEVGTGHSLVDLRCQQPAAHTFCQPSRTLPAGISLISRHFSTTCIMHENCTCEELKGQCKMVGRQGLHAESAPNELASKASANGKLEKLFRNLTGASGKVRLQTSPLAINAEIADFNFSISLRP
jgi:hypothetical protein